MFNARILETNEGKEDENLSELDQDSSDDCVREGSLRSNLIKPKRKLVLIESDDEEWKIDEIHGGSSIFLELLICNYKVVLISNSFTEFIKISNNFFYHVIYPCHFFY